MDSSDDVSDKKIHTLPDVLSIEGILSARKDEILRFEQAISGGNKKMSISQRLPTHMRRRAMSHSAKRMPSYLRNAYRKQLEKNQAGKKQSKCPRRKYRRRPSNLLTEYNRRQNKFVWLETHIWHAKRFKMSSKWGYKLPEYAYNKVFRASYRAFSYHCLVQDISYYCCIEIQGPLLTLLNGFKSITSSECGLTMAAKCWLKGTRQGTVMLFHNNAYPYKFIGNVEFIWKPPSLDLAENRTIWIWCHPTYYEELVGVLTELFNLVETLENSTDKINNASSSNTGGKEQIKLSVKNIPFYRTPKYVNVKLDVRMTLLKDTLNRFKLTGPLSNAILAKAFHEPCNVVKDDQFFANIDDKQRSHIQSKQVQIAEWWELFTKNNDFQNYTDLLSETNSPTQFPPCTVIGCYIADPRLHLPTKRTKATPKNRDCRFLATPADQWCHNEIWNSEVRDMSTKCILATSVLNKLRSNLLVGGHDLHLHHVVKSVIPMLLIQRPGDNSNSRMGLGSGWDIIFPAGWGMPVWMSLILNGARPGALRESRTINFESKIIQFPPDSKAGNAHYKNIEHTFSDCYFKLPPNKRPNYLKLGFPTPFSCPWSRLLREWRSVATNNENNDDEYVKFFVLRNRSYNRMLADDFQNLKRKSTNYHDIAEDYYRNKNCLLAVSIKIVDKGKLEPFSHIYLPIRNDLKTRWSCSRASLPVDIVEKAHSDKNISLRKTCRKEHRALLKFLRKERIMKKKLEKMEQSKSRSKRKQSPPTSDFVKEYNIRMRNLWIPALPDTFSIRHHCEREIIGFIVNGGFSFVESCTIGHGYIAFDALLTLIKLYHATDSIEPTVLIRSPSTSTYRRGKISIVSI